ncbi:MAG: hypothetical protein ACPGSC_15285 [Granulosicoccaceae bacterium]
MCHQKDFHREEFINAAALVASRLAERIWDQGPSELLALSDPPDTIDEGKLYSIAQACKLLEISRSTFDRRAKQAGIKRVKRLLPTIRYRKVDIDKLRR